MQSKLQAEDVQFNGSLFFEKIIKKKNGGYYQLSLGVAYQTISGATRVIPVTNFKARLNKYWSFALGMPNMNVKLDLNEKHSLKIVADLNDFNANIQSHGSINGNLSPLHAVFTNVSAGLEYTYWAAPAWGITLRAVHSLYDIYQLRDSSNESVHDFNATLKPYLSIGLKFNPIRKLQNKVYSSK